jgi:hypothetical protein
MVLSIRSIRSPYDALILAAGQPLRHNMFSPRRHGVAGLLPEPAHRERHRLAFDQPMIEPRGPGRRHLLVEINVRPVDKNEGGTGIVGAAEPASLDDASDRRCMLESVDPPEAHMVSAAVGTVDHGAGFACQFVVQLFVDQAPEDR